MPSAVHNGKAEKLRELQPGVYKEFPIPPGLSARAAANRWRAAAIRLGLTVRIRTMGRRLLIERK